jgi:hypothetical protein
LRSVKRLARALRSCEYDHQAHHTTQDAVSTTAAALWGTDEAGEPAQLVNIPSKSQQSARQRNDRPAHHRSLRHFVSIAYINWPWVGVWRADCNMCLRSQKHKHSGGKRDEDSQEGQTDQQEAREEGPPDPTVQGAAIVCGPWADFSPIRGDAPGMVRFTDFARMAEGRLPRRPFCFPRPRLYQICERSQRHAARPTCHAAGEDRPAILAVPVIPSISEPSGFGKTISTAK